ncbi:MAG: hypothetical protein AB1540_14355 [Bdellovibrionota bacterium]
MASVRRQKEALRAAAFAYLAGAHCVTEEVEKSLELADPKRGAQLVDSQREMLRADYKRVIESRPAIETFLDVLDEEELYPFGSEWPRDEIAQLIVYLVPPKLRLGDDSEPDLRFRFRKGFKKILAEFASTLESIARQHSTLDHWMALLLNTAFHAGVVAAAQSAENSKAYYAAIPEIEEETEPWSRYPQLLELLERQLRRETRRRTGLVTGLDF